MCLCIEDNMAFYHFAIPYTYAFFFFFFILFVIFVLLLLLTTEPYPKGDRDPEEKWYYDPNSNSKKMFSSLDEKASVHLSVVIPAYNEEERLPPMLDEMIHYLESRVKTFPQFKYEAIIVSDGSKDKTVEVSHSYCKKYGHEKIKCLELLKNRGKGGAVRLGIQSARGAIILFADADGATKFEDLSKLEASLQKIVSANYFNNMKAVEDELAIVIGSRAHLEKESLSSRSLFRTILMYGFHFLVWLFTVRSIKDTQCGFKLFTRKAAQICFKNLHVERWAFDVELLYMAEILAISISEISVNWTEIDGSKVTPVWSWIQMGCDLGLIWLKYKIGAWKLAVNKID